MPYDVDEPYTHKIAGRSLFTVTPRFLEGLPEGKVAQVHHQEMTAIGDELVADYFHIFDSDAELASEVPQQRFLPYMKYILSSRLAPYALKAAVTHANIEHNRLVDAVRHDATTLLLRQLLGVFIDTYDPESDAYVNLFQPVGVSIKAAGTAREVEFSAAEVHHIFDRLKPAEPVLPLGGVLGYPRPKHILEKFRYPITGV